MNRIVWIDHLRGFCMILILWFHTEMFFADKDIIPYRMYVTNSLTIFYFISGYLFYHQRSFSIRHKMKSIFRNLIIPSFVLIYLFAGSSESLYQQYSCHRCNHQNIDR